ncbi:MAG: tripartite tricarboxylate transporter TctB family protein [Proteobacteria bacterium]|nr:tripartite tricarboxylate transporter TctB family protein [Pseudomonadota bacterium]
MIDRLVGLICALIGAGAIWHAQTLHVPFAADPVGPRVFPTIIGGVLILCGFILMLRPGPVTMEFGTWPRALAVLVASLIYPLLLLPIGFIAATALLCFVAALAFHARPLPAAVSAVATAVVFFVLLDKMLDLPLPRGPLGI